MKEINRVGSSFGRRGTIILLLLIIFFLITIVVVSAMMIKRADSSAYFEKGKVSCSIEVKVDGDAGKTSGEYLTSVIVTNSGNIDSYVRVSGVFNWVDESGVLQGETSEIPNLTLSGDWIKGGDGYYYYRIPLKSGKATSNLLGGSYRLKSGTNSLSEPIFQQAEMVGQAIQALPKRAVEEAWGVSVGSDGTISVP